MDTVRFTNEATIGGVKIAVNTDVQADAVGPVFQPEVPLALAATGWTKGTASTGTATMAEGHGLTTSDLVDVYWDGGYRYGMECTVTENSVALADGDNAGGDDFPANGTDVILAPQANMTISFVGNNLKGLAATANPRSLLVLIADDDSLFAYELDSTEGKGVLWAYGSGSANPWTGKTIASATVSSADTVGTTPNEPIVAGIMFDSTP